MGPSETERQADTPAVQAIYAAFRADPGQGRMAPHTHRMPCQAIETAGVELGAYGHRIVGLAVAVAGTLVADVLLRAYAWTVAAGGAMLLLGYARRSTARPYGRCTRGGCRPLT